MSNYTTTKQVEPVNKTLYKFERNQRVFDLRAQGESYNSIARALKLSPQRVAEILKLHKKYYEEVKA